MSAFRGAARKRTLTGVPSGVQRRHLCSWESLRRGATGRERPQQPLPVRSCTAGVGNRLAFALDLRGPVMVVGTYCSSSPVAIDAACGGADSRRVRHGAGEPGKRPRGEVAVARADRAEPVAVPDNGCLAAVCSCGVGGGKVMSLDVVQGIKRYVFRFEAHGDLHGGVSRRSVPVKRVGQPIGRSDRPWPADSGSLIPCTTWRDAVGPQCVVHGA
ncbi:beta-ketoacyl synthase N-terminal-like domain-containing protein [Streptomyces prunicolor]|uniref:beta-ketoacyl synthase N-terminal-like domain-containing protein n=1 Tax=Streptomyces prunicolor TaxID=67348 RepID=UPI003865589F